MTTMHVAPGAVDGRRRAYRAGCRRPRAAPAGLLRRTGN
ncbi:hypothetical protein XCR_0633 [Xanthomonas campestris pv. raphani 756C]|nr:hypothetical protein XCR_0633 [Xanthomonas campestris pv. raphani 756C]